MGNRGVCLSAANKPFLQKLSGILQQHAIPILGLATTDDMAVRLCHSLYPDVLISHQFLGSGSGFSAAEALLGHTPAIVLCQRGEADYPAIEGVYSMYLPLNASELLKKIDEVGAYGRALRIASQEMRLTEQRDIIKKAKDRMMRLQDITEPQAHAVLQRLSMDGRIKLYEAAEKMLARLEAGQDDATITK